MSFFFCCCPIAVAFKIRKKEENIKRRVSQLCSRRFWWCDSDGWLNIITIPLISAATDDSVVRDARSFSFYIDTLKLF